MALPAIYPVPSDVELRFWKAVRKRGPAECWPWLKGRDPSGYGVIAIKGKNYRATHIALSLDDRPRVSDLQALHQCDQRACCNPAHLRWGTIAENVEDCVKRGRRGNFKGQFNANSSLTPERALFIRRSTIKGSRVAAKFGISQSLVSSIRNGKAWKHLELDI